MIKGSARDSGQDGSKAGLRAVHIGMMQGAA
jgi:hypothetical protein